MDDKLLELQKQFEFAQQAKSSIQLSERNVVELGQNLRSVDVISGCLKVGMSVARFDFSLGDPDYHQEVLENLKAAVKSTKKLCAVMLDTVGAELQVVNKRKASISLQA
uniref:pyruvate kinase n=1 Tax=Fagus sylvatica TaxID=28930 RepID=A0A2N9HW54_FAGSY